MVLKWLTTKLSNLCLFLSIYLSFSFYLSIYLSTHLSILSSNYLPTYLSIYLSIYQPFYLLSIYLSIYLTIYLSVRPSVHPSILPPISHIYLFIYVYCMMSVSFNLSIILSNLIYSINTCLMTEKRSKSKQLVKKIWKSWLALFALWCTVVTSSHKLPDCVVFTRTSLSSVQWCARSLNGPLRMKLTISSLSTFAFSVFSTFFHSHLIPRYSFL